MLYGFIVHIIGVYEFSTKRESPHFPISDITMLNILSLDYTEKKINDNCLFLSKNNFIDSS